MTDITTIDWKQNFQPSQQIQAENIQLKQINWILISLTSIVLIGTCVYIYKINQEKKEMNYNYYIQ